MRSLAISQLELNLRGHAWRLMPAVLELPLLHDGWPYLICLNSVELSQVRDFRWSPVYAETDVYSALQADPLESGCTCVDYLANCLYASLRYRDTVLLPHPLANAHDAFLANAHAAWCRLGEQILLRCVYQPDQPHWSSDFKDALGHISVASSVEIGFSTAQPPPASLEWSVDDFHHATQLATNLFTSAFDGEAFLLWTLEAL